MNLKLLIKKLINKLFINLINTNNIIIMYCEICHKFLEFIERIKSLCEHKQARCKNCFIECNECMIKYIQEITTLRDEQKAIANEIHDMECPACLSESQTNFELMSESVGINTYEYNYNLFCWECTNKSCTLKLAEYNSLIKDAVEEGNKTTDDIYSYVFNKIHEVILK